MKKVFILLLLLFIISGCTQQTRNVWTLSIKSWSIVNDIPDITYSGPGPFTWLRLDLTIKNNTYSSQNIAWYDNDNIEYIPDTPGPYDSNYGFFYSELPTKFNMLQSHSGYLYIRIPYDDNLDGTVKVSMKLGPVDIRFKLPDIEHD